MTIGVRRNPQLWGWYPTYYLDRISNVNLNNAATFIAYAIFVDSAKALSKVRLFCTITGSPIAADFRCELYSDNAGLPNASLETATAPGSVATNTYIEWTGFTTTLQPNTMYWLVFKNLNATPASNFYSPKVHQANSIQPFVGGPEVTTLWGWSTKSSLNSGSTWGTSLVVSQASFRAEFGDGSFDGFPLGTLGTLQVYSSREAGVYFVSPDVPLNVKGVAMPLFKTGTATGSVRYRIYIGNSSSPTLQGTTDGTNLTAGRLTASAGYFPLSFSTAITIPPSSVVRVVLSESTQSDASTNRYNVPKWDMENDANTKALMGGYQSTLSTDGGATFAETDTDVVPFALILGQAAGVTVGGSEYSLPKNLPLTRYRRGHLVRI